MSKMSPTFEEAYLALRDNNDVQPLKDYLAAGGGVAEKTFFPFYYFGPVVQDIELVKKLMDRGMTIVPDWNFFTCIADGMSDEVFKWALDNDLDKIKYDITTLSYAYRHRERFVELLRRGMNIHAENRYGRETAMESAVEEEDVAGIEFLCEQGFNINYMTTHTALHRTCFSDVTVEVIKSMVRLGADPSIKASDGRDAIMIICNRINPGKDSLEKIKYLSLVCPGWVTSQDEDGANALHYAVNHTIENDHRHIVSLLLSLGADYTLKNRYNNDAVDICFIRKNLEVFRCFFDFWKAKSIPIDYPWLFAKCEKHGADNIKQFLVESQLETMIVDVDAATDIAQQVVRQLDAMNVESD
jgi:hypothetical protein